MAGAAVVSCVSLAFLILLYMLYDQHFRKAFELRLMERHDQMFMLVMRGHICTDDEAYEIFEELLEQLRESSVTIDWLASMLAKWLVAPLFQRDVEMFDHVWWRATADLPLQSREEVRALYEDVQRDVLRLIISRALSPITMFIPDRIWEALWRHPSITAGLTAWFYPLDARHAMTTWIWQTPRKAA